MRATWLFTGCSQASDYSQIFAGAHLTARPSSVIMFMVRSFREAPSRGVYLVERMRRLRLNASTVGIDADLHARDLIRAARLAPPSGQS